MSFSSCCFNSENKTYHFENFTFVRLPDLQSVRTASFATARSYLPSRFRSERPRRLRRKRGRADLHNQQNKLAMPSKPDPPAGVSSGHSANTDRHVFFAPESSGHTSNYAPPPGPPPTQHQNSLPATYQPLQGPPPSEKSNQDDVAPPPYHDWTVIPDTALLPPPPGFSYREPGSAFGETFSPVANADPADADRAHAWTAANPLWRPLQLTPSQQKGLTIGFSSLIVPRELKGEVKPNKSHPGLWRVSTKKTCNDACMLSSMPLYSAVHGHPASTGQSALIYFEVRMGELGPDSGVALGFVAPPYPTWRLPGWERASLGVHGDDGRRFINDTWGGRDFVPPFNPGDTVGLGMHLRGSAEPPAYNQLPASHLRLADVEVFFTRNGKLEGKWDLHEDVDAEMEQPGGVTGLDGDRDLYAAIGVYGPCEFEIKLGRHNWLYKPQV